MFLHYWRGIPIGYLTRDPTAVAGIQAYIGFFSQLGIFFWAGAAAVCFMCAAILTRHAESSEARKFLLVSGLVTLWLSFDDVFLLHEEVFPYFGVPETLVVLSYPGLVLLYLFRFRFLILNTEYMVLATALFFFGASVVLDFYKPPQLDRYLFEDGAKLTGIVAWLTYFFRVGMFAVRRRVALGVPN
ncbi:MAG: hypothetical protein KF749_03750 [Bacteroidetes bacterium]|nr:hypothetical protein [Bacteroidota bacterium]MCW5897519.1 hypothetical protein [Bacteroidota bacterium]